MKNIEIYSSNDCPYCTHAKSLLKSKGILYREFVVDGNPELAAEAVRRSDGMRTVPQIFIENDHVGGYDDLAALDKSGKLNALLGLESSNAD